MKEITLKNGWTIKINEDHFKSILTQSKVILIYDDLKVISEIELEKDSIMIKKYFIM
ncbi:hypothetical protein [Terrilactibacillus laevilacticus]|uniref:Uncharacterized protein n=1 Tax=Terrilactibacillus laevilacticus TaxID=1380157 RepID=A0ABW5PT86_9BACI|nr:hypothetical protein [Terrilactibacillus laevilacticus]